MQLKLMQLNAQDLFLDLAYELGPDDVGSLSDAQWQLLGQADRPVKPLERTVGLARAILAEAPDVVCMNEVGGEASLRNFAHLFLGDAYVPHLVRGNDRRGIDNGFLVKASLPLHAELRSHKDWPVPFQYPFEADPEAYFVTAEMSVALDLEKPEERKLSRDAPALRLFRPGESEPCLILLSVHLKSPFDPDNIDTGGGARRAAELVAVLDIAAALTAETQGNTPVILAGDFNTNAALTDTSEEARVIYERTGYRDVLELDGRPPYDRITQLSFFAGAVHSNQLDYLFLPPVLQQRFVQGSGYVHRYRFAGDDGEMQLPLSFRDRAWLPSDHYPVLATLEL